MKKYNIETDSNKFFGFSSIRSDHDETFEKDALAAIQTMDKLYPQVEKQILEFFRTKAYFVGSMYEYFHQFHPQIKYRSLTGTGWIIAVKDTQIHTSQFDWLMIYFLWGGNYDGGNPYIKIELNNYFNKNYHFFYSSISSLRSKFFEFMHQRFRDGKLKRRIDVITDDV